MHDMHGFNQGQSKFKSLGSSDDEYGIIFVQEHWLTWWPLSLGRQRSLYIHQFRVIRVVEAEIARLSHCETTGYPSLCKSKKKLICIYLVRAHESVPCPFFCLFTSCPLPGLILVRCQSTSGLILVRCHFTSGLILVRCQFTSRSKTGSLPVHFRSNTGSLPVQLPVLCQSTSGLILVLCQFNSHSMSVYYTWWHCLIVYSAVGSILVPDL